MLHSFRIATVETERPISKCVLPPDCMHMDEVRQLRDDLPWLATVPTGLTLFLTQYPMSNNSFFKHGEP